MHMSSLRGLTVRKRVVVVCPGRGSYTAENLGTFRSLGPSEKQIVAEFDDMRRSLGEVTLTELDAADKFKVSLHTKGEHASPLIYACAYLDYHRINQEKYEIVGVLGNSMGWYLTLAMTEALSRATAFDLVQSMGSMMKDQIVGGQVIYSLVGADWKTDWQKVAALDSVVAKLRAEGGQVYDSIYLGGMRVIGADRKSLQALLKELPADDKYPFQLVNHGAFHTPLCNDISDQALRRWGSQSFGAPKVPMIDGQGVIWQPWSTDAEMLRRYTLGHQVYAPYDFSASVRVALREFAPDQVILLGPGGSLGGAIGQVLIETNWQDIKSKSDFVERQKEDPILLSMGLEAQREMVVHA